MFPVPFAIGSLNNICKLVLGETLVALSAGVKLLTNGGVMSEALPWVVMAKSSIPNPSSAPVALNSFHLIQNVAPFGIFKPVIVILFAVLLIAAFPSKGPTVPAVVGAIKFRPASEI